MTDMAKTIISTRFDPLKSKVKGVSPGFGVYRGFFVIRRYMNNTL